MNINWRPYQIEAKKAIKKKYDEGINKQLIVQATGTGKRLAALDLVKHFRKSLFIAHREELIMQAYDEIEPYYPMNVGIIKGSLFEVDKKIVIASVQTLHNRLDRLVTDLFDLVIVDEAHRYMAKTYVKTVRYFTPKLLTGWTATPKRLDGLSLSNLFQEIVYQYTIENGVKDGFLANLEAYQIATRSDISQVGKVAGDFNQKQLSEKIDNPERNRLIVDKYLEYCKHEEQAVAYCIDIDHCYHLKEVFLEKGIITEVVVSDTERCPNRSEIIEHFRNGNIQVLINVEILTEGFDYSDIGCIIMARPTQSETLYIQVIGRGTRLKSQKFIERTGHDKCIVLDFVDNTGKHKLVNAWELEKDKPIEERIFLPESHRQKLLEEREKRERRILARQGQDRKIDLFKLPEVKVWNSEKMLEPATEKQLAWMKNMGIYQDDVEYTKLMASELISNQPCYEWQVRWLAVHGYDVSKGASIGQYQKVKRAIDEKNKYSINQNN